MHPFTLAMDVGSKDQGKNEIILLVRCSGSVESVV